MDYAAKNQMPNDAMRQAPELGKLKAIGERIAMASAKVGHFLDRFHGPAPAIPAGSDTACDNYRNDLETIFEQLNRLEGTVASLDTIG